MAHYLDLLHPDGSLNRAVFEQILASRVLTEIDRRLCNEHGIRARAGQVRLGEVGIYYARMRAEMRLGPIADAERARITHQQRLGLMDYVQAMQAAADKQRDAMMAAE